MCSSADPTQEKLRDSQAAFTNTLQTAFKSTFANQQQILSGLTATLTKAIANPAGFTPAQMAALRTGAMDSTANTTANATKAAGEYAATHGGADLGSGVQAQIQGGIQVAGAQQLAGQNQQITLADAAQRQQNYWNSISGLTQVGAAYNPAGIAGVETNSANATSTASQVVDAERQQSWNNAFGVVNGIAGLAGAATGLGGLTSLMPKGKGPSDPANPGYGG